MTGSCRCRFIAQYASRHSKFGCAEIKSVILVFSIRRKLAAHFYLAIGWKYAVLKPSAFLLDNVIEKIPSFHWYRRPATLKSPSNGSKLKKLCENLQMAFRRRLKTYNRYIAKSGRYAYASWQLCASTSTVMLARPFPRSTMLAGISKRDTSSFVAKLIIQIDGGCTCVALSGRWRTIYLKNKWVSIEYLLGYSRMPVSTNHKRLHSSTLVR